MSLATAIFGVLLTIPGDGKIPPAMQIPPAKMVPQPPPPRDLEPHAHLCRTRSFLLPVGIDGEFAKRGKWLVLYWSTDRGRSWQVCKRVQVRPDELLAVP